MSIRDFRELQDGSRVSLLYLTTAQQGRTAACLHLRFVSTGERQVCREPRHATWTYQIERCACCETHRVRFFPPALLPAGELVYG